MSIEAMKQALEALENIMLERDLDSATTIARNARYGLRQAIQAAEKQEQDTLAYREAARLAKWLFKKHYAHEEHYAYGRVVWGLCDTTAGVISQIDNMVCQLVKAEKQEPVAWIHKQTGVITKEWSFDKNLFEPLYTHPQPKRELVGLTDEEMRELEKQFNAERVRTSDEEYLVIYPADYWNWQRAIEAKLKEKNT